MDEPGTVMLLDSASLYFRAFFGVPDRRTRPDEPPSNAVRGFLDMVATLVADHGPSALVACWDDDWRPAFRVAAIPTYKTHRLADGSQSSEQVPDALAPQVPVIAALLAAIGLDRVGCPGFEADDVIGALARAQAGRRRVDVVTGDRDLFQLVDDARGVRVLYTGKGGVRSPDVITQEQLRARYGVPTGAAYADLAVLRGDASDGLPGVPGVGEKTAAQLIARYGDLAAVRLAAESGDPVMSPAVRRRLLDAAAYLDVAPAVVAAGATCPAPTVTGQLPTQVTDPDAVARLSAHFGLATSMARLLRALGVEPLPSTTA